MSVKKTRSDKGVPRKTQPTQREQSIRWYALLSFEERQRFRDDLQLVDWLQCGKPEPDKPEEAPASMEVSQ